MGRKKRKEKLLKDITFTGIANKGRAVGREPEGRVVFSTQAVPGDIADIKVIKKKSAYYEGLPIAYRQFSEHRAAPFCDHFEQCGGCRWQHMQYPAQLTYKDREVRQTLQRIGGVSSDVFEPILGADGHERYYRNKMEYSFSSKKWLTTDEIRAGITNQENVLGFHVAGAFDKVIDIHACHLQAPPTDHIRNSTRDIALRQNLTFYDARKHEGFLRNIMIRLSTTGEVMVVISFGFDEPKKREMFLEAVLTSCPEITTLYYVVNTKVNDFINDLPMHNYFGPGFIMEKMGQLYFKISPKSFFQTNTYQGTRLYDLVANMITRDEASEPPIVYDLYTGTGSIALYVAHTAKKVIGIEEVADAVKDARDNAIRNEISNVTFFTGDVKDVLTASFAAEHGQPDVVITDPPRAGMHKSVVEFLLTLNAPQIIYVSCNPGTQARDLDLMKEQYKVIRSCAVDMFPHTDHVENVVLLERF